MDQEQSVRVLLDETASTEERIQAIGELENSDSPKVLAALLSVAEDEAAPETVAREVGQVIAQILLRGNRIYDVSFADFSGPAYLAFDQTVAQMQEQLRTGE